MITPENKQQEAQQQEAQQQEAQQQEAQQQLVFTPNADVFEKDNVITIISRRAIRGNDFRV